MHVLILLLILLAIYFIVIYWKITTPIIYLLVYLMAMLFRDKEKGNKVWFHTLWLLGLAALLSVVFFGATGLDFASDWSDEYSNYDELTSYEFSRIDSVKCVDVELMERLKREDEERLIGPLEVGMWPVRVTYLKRKWKEMESFELAGVRLSSMESHYHKGGLYGVSYSFKEDSLFSQADSIVGVLKQKYGPMQLEQRDEKVYKAAWVFEHKHVVVDSEYNRGYSWSKLYIYEPNLRLKKVLRKEEKLEKEMKREERRLERQYKKKKEHEERMKREKQESEKREKEVLESI